MAPMQRPAKALPRQMTCTVVAWETSTPARQKGKAVEMMVTWDNTRPCDCPSLGKDPATKSDEFLEKFQTAFEPPPQSLENYIAIFL